MHFLFQYATIPPNFIDLTSKTQHIFPKIISSQLPNFSQFLYSGHRTWNKSHFELIFSLTLLPAHSFLTLDFNSKCVLIVSSSLQYVINSAIFLYDNYSNQTHTPS